MNLLLIQPEEILVNSPSDKPFARITDRRFKHIKKILKASTGDKLIAGELNGKIGHAEIVEMDNESVTVSLDLYQSAPQPQNCTLIAALPRPLMFKRILQNVTTLGVKQLHFIQANKVEKSYWNSSDLQAETIQQQLLLGLEQAQDTLLPEVYFHRNFRQFIENKLPGLVSSTEHCLLAQPQATDPCPTNLQQTSLLVIGPESGFTEKENQLLIDTGLKPIHIGKRILRVETAVSSLLGKILPFN